MARWTDVADWIGPTPNRRPNGIKAHRGLVLHIQEGSEAGTEAWQRNPKSQISSHFLAPKVGRPRQMVDTNDVAWTEASGNDSWLSVEIEGHTGDSLTADQLAGIAAVYARGMREYGWKLQTADSPTGYGLGWHGMGGKAWGGHYDCPGDPIRNQRAAVLGAVQRTLTGKTPATKEDDMAFSASYKLPTTPGQSATFSIGPSGAGSQLGPCWISVGVDGKNGVAKYRLALSADGKSWDLYEGTKAVTLDAAAPLWGIQLKPGQRIISVDCLDGTTYKSELYLAVEYGPKG